MIGLAAIAAAAMMAFVGVTSASATSLEEVVNCKALEDPCLGGSFASGTTVHGTASNPELLGSFGINIKCATSTVLGKTTSSLAHGTIESLGWSECENNDGQECEVTSEHLPYLSKVVLTADHKGYEQLVTETNKGRPAANVNCPNLNCSYGAKEVLFEVLHTGTGGAVVLDVLQTLAGEGGFCVFTAGVWHAKYEVTCTSSHVGCWPAMEAGSKL
jgi:hypothetical protein